MNDYSFGNFLRQLRERAGLSQYQLGYLVGVSDRAVSKWEVGASKPKTKILPQLSEVLGVTEQELLSGTYQKEKESSVFSRQYELWAKAYRQMLVLYGTNPPLEILARYYQEWSEWQALDAIIYFDLLGCIHQKAKESDEYMLLRGATGSSFAAFLMGASDINPLPAHYYCPKCHHVEFHKNIGCCWDLPQKSCDCGELYIRDGHNIPHETQRFSVQHNSVVNICISDRMMPIARDVIAQYFSGYKILMLEKDDSEPNQVLLLLKDDCSEYVNGQIITFQEFCGRLIDQPCIDLWRNSNIEKIQNAAQYEKRLSNDIEKILTAFSVGKAQKLLDANSEDAIFCLQDAKPQSFQELIRAVAYRWVIAPYHPAIYCREDIFQLIRDKGMALGIDSSGLAYEVMEKVRRGKYYRAGVPPIIRKQLQALKVEEKTIDYLSQVHYLPAKADICSQAQYAIRLLQAKL